MGCEEKDLSFVQGDTYELTMTVYRTTGAATEDDCGCDDGVAPQTPLDLTGATIKMVSSTGYYGELGNTVLWTITNGTGDILVTWPHTGQFIIIIPTTATINLVGTQLNSLYEVVVELPTDSVGKAYRTTVLRGNLILSPSVLGA